MRSFRFSFHRATTRHISFDDRRFPNPGIEEPDPLLKTRDPKLQAPRPRSGQGPRHLDTWLTTDGRSCWCQVVDTTRSSCWWKCKVMTGRPLVMLQHNLPATMYRLPYNL